MNELELKEIREINHIGDKTVCEVIAYQGTEVFAIKFKFRSIYDNQFARLFQHVIPVKEQSRT
jgi:hypothetical protein